MAKKLIRNVMLNVNRFQKCIIYPVIISCLTTCALTIMYLFLFYVLDDRAANVYNLNREDLRVIIPWVMMGLSCMLFVIVLWTYRVSNKLVGPYERVLTELDAVLNEGKKTPIKARDGDSLFEELLVRINALIAKLP